MLGQLQLRWCRDIANRLSLRSRFDKLWVVGRSPDSRIDDFELPSQISQWPISLEISALTVAGPCRIFTGFPITPTVVRYKLWVTRKSRGDCGRQICGLGDVVVWTRRTLSYPFSHGKVPRSAALGPKLNPTQRRFICYRQNSC